LQPEKIRNNILKQSQEICALENFQRSEAFCILMLLILQYWIKINYLGGKNEGGAVAAAEPGAGTVVWPQQAAEWGGRGP
jgi:hypothetical protein